MNIWRRLKYLLLPSYRRAEERELQEELESLRAIAGPRELGNLSQAAENARAIWGWNWLDDLGQDFRYALRTLLRHRRVTAVALLSLGLGIGANTVVFTILNTMLFRPMPFPQPDRLVRVGFHQQNNPGQLTGLTRGNCASFSKSEIFEQFGCYTDGVSASIADANPSGLSTSERINGQRLTAGAAQTAGIPPLFGRWFTESDEREGADLVMLISSSLWQRRFGGSGDALGRVVRLDGEAATIIGVLPEQFEFVGKVTNADYWIPVQMSPEGQRSPARVLGGLGRLKSGVSLSAAQFAMDAVAAQLAEESPETNKGWYLRIRPLLLEDVDILADTGDLLLILQGAVAFVLFIACANVAGLLLAQGSTQHKEVAVRTALGSNRWRIFRQLISHSILLSLGGGILGMIVGWWGIRLLVNSLPAGLPRAVYEPRLDINVLALTMLVSIACALLVGIVPALQNSHADPLDAMRESSRGATASRGRQRLRSAFVAGQIALAFILLVGTGLMVNGLFRLVRMPIGFDLNNLITVSIELPDAKFRRPTKTVLGSGALEMRIDPQMYLTTEQIRQKLSAIPGVTVASAIAIRPPLSGTINMPVRIDGKSGSEQQRAQFLPILSDYFKTLQVPVIQGREFTTQDRMGSLPVAIINRAMARFFWPNESAIGKQIQIDAPLLPNQPMREIVGIVEEVMQYTGQESRPQLYIPYVQMTPEHDERLTNDLRRMTFVVRTSLPVSKIIPAVTEAVSLVDSSQAISSVRTMQDTAFNMKRRNVFVGMLGAFASIAVLLAVIGIYGVMAQIVSQRTNEIGIRIALGSDPRRVRSLIILRGGLLIGIGLVLGTIGALALTRVLQNALFGVSGTDPLTFVLAAALLGGIAVVACYVPARRASRIDPMVALRYE